MNLDNWASIRFERTENQGQPIFSLRQNQHEISLANISIIDRIVTFIKNFFSTKNAEIHKHTKGSLSPKISSLSTDSAVISESSIDHSGQLNDLEKQINDPKKGLSDKKLKTALLSLVGELKKTSEDQRKEFAFETFSARIDPLKKCQLQSGSMSASFFAHIDDLFKSIEEKNKHEIDVVSEFAQDRSRLQNPIFGKKVTSESAINLIKTELARVFPENQQNQTTVDREKLLKRTLKILSQSSLNLILILWGADNSVKGVPSSYTMRLDSTNKIIEIKSTYEIREKNFEDEPRSLGSLNVTMYIPLDPDQIAQFDLTRVVSGSKNITNKFLNFAGIFAKG